MTPLYQAGIALPFLLIGLFLVNQLKSKTQDIVFYGQ